MAADLEEGLAVGWRCAATTIRGASPSESDEEEEMTAAFRLAVWDSWACFTAGGMAGLVRGLVGGGAMGALSSSEEDEESSEESSSEEDELAVCGMTAAFR